VKQANLHDALSSCRFSLFVAVNILEHSDVSFNSVQAPHSTSKPLSILPLFQDLKSDFLCVLILFSILFPKKKQASIFYRIKC